MALRRFSYRVFLRTKCVMERTPERTPNDGRPDFPSQLPLAGAVSHRSTNDWNNFSAFAFGIGCLFHKKIYGKIKNIKYKAEYDGHHIH